MNRTDARRIAETITNQQLKEMFDSAKENIKDWTTTSSVNKGFTKGLAWNILAANFDTNEEHHILAKTSMIREFGDRIHYLISDSVSYGISHVKNFNRIFKFQLRTV